MGKITLRCHPGLYLTYFCVVNDMSIRKSYKLFFLFCLILSGSIFLVSCGLSKPLKLDPTKDHHPGIDRLALLNGDYRILSVDSNLVRLDYALTYKELYKYNQFPDTSDFVRLMIVDDQQINVQVFKKGNLVKTKTIKGVFQNGYFQFHSEHVAWRAVFWVHLMQTNRLTLTSSKDLLLDNYYGGIGFFLILPVPLSGSSSDNYNLIYKRIR